MIFIKRLICSWFGHKPSNIQQRQVKAVGIVVGYETCECARCDHHAWRLNGIAGTAPVGSGNVKVDTLIAQAERMVGQELIAAGVKLDLKNLKPLPTEHE